MQCTSNVNVMKFQCPCQCHPPNPLVNCKPNQNLLRKTCLIWAVGLVRLACDFAALHSIKKK